MLSPAEKLRRAPGPPLAPRAPAARRRAPGPPLAPRAPAARRRAAQPSSAEPGSSRGRRSIRTAHPRAAAFELTGARRTQNPRETSAARLRSTITDPSAGRQIRLRLITIGPHRAAPLSTGKPRKRFRWLRLALRPRAIDVCRRSARAGLLIPRGGRRARLL